MMTSIACNKCRKDLDSFEVRWYDGICTDCQVLKIKTELEAQEKLRAETVAEQSEEANKKK